MFTAVDMHQSASVRTAGQRVLSVGILAIYQYPQRFPHIGRVFFGADPVLQLYKPLEIRAFSSLLSTSSILAAGVPSRGE